MKKYIIYLFILLPLGAISQNSTKGKILDTTNNPIIGANIYWENSTIGVISNENGVFEIKNLSNNKTLIVSYIGYKSQSITVNESSEITVNLTPDNELNEISLNSVKQSSNRPSYEIKNIINVNKAELLKAACCNLAESFETNPSIDVNYSDALTGTKQIKMLGLSSPYIQIVQENVPNIRGAAQTFGLSFTPGTWVESIQVTKGAGSVVNGYESITGQINAELVKPLSDKKLFVNIYTSVDGRSELNTHFNKILNDKWSTGLYVHGNLRNNKMDENNDSFLDVPLSNQINIMNRWQYTDTEKGWVSFGSFRFETVN